MAAVVQRLERGIVVPDVEGSIPSSRPTHPLSTEGFLLIQRNFRAVMIRHILRLVVSIVPLALMLTAASSALAQSRSCPVPPPSPFKHTGLIRTSYDPRARFMRTTLEHPRAIGSAPDTLYLAASFLHNGAEDTSRPDITLLLISNSGMLTQHDARRLVMLADGYPQLFSPARYSAQRSATTKKVLAAVELTLTHDALLKLIGAAKIEARLGATRFELTADHLEALREIVSLAAPSGGGWVISER